MGIEEKVEENPYNLLFNTNSFVVKVRQRNMWPYTEYFLEMIDYRRMGNSQRLERYRAIRRLEDDEEDQETKEEEQMINVGKIFKLDECVICLTNPPNVLFCNCGHLCLCAECDETKGLDVCPVFKTENYIKGMVE